MMSSQEASAHRSSKNSKHDVDEFLSSLGVDSKSLSLVRDELSNEMLKEETTSKNEDILSFLNESDAKAFKVSENPIEGSSETTTAVVNNDKFPKESGAPEKIQEVPKETAIKEREHETKPSIIQEKLHQGEKGAQTSWSFGGLWSSASSAIKNTPKSEYLLSNVASVKTALSGLSETVRSNENAQYLGSAVKGLVASENINKLGNNLKTFTQQSVASVLTTFQGLETHQTLNVYLLTDQEFSGIESLSYQLLDPLMQDELLFQDVYFLDGKDLLENFSTESTRNYVSFKTAQGFTDGFNEAKTRALALSDALNNYSIQKDKRKTAGKEEDLLSQIEDQVLTPTTTADIFVVCQPCRAAPLPDSASFFYCLTLFCPTHSDTMYKTFSQPLPACTNLSSRGKSTKNDDSTDEDLRQLSLKSIQLALHFLLIDFFEAESKLRKSEDKKTEDNSK